VTEPSDKRIAPRAATDFVVELYETDGHTLIGIARLLNLSVTGAYVETTSPLVDKSSLTVRLLLGKRHLLSLPGEIVWVRTLPHMRQRGGRFGAYPDPARELITKFVQEYFNSPEAGDFLAVPPRA
jgi:hypothetical protein